MVKTNSIPSVISSNAPALSGTDIRGIKAPIVIPNIWLWVIGGLAVALLAALAWWLWRKRRREAPTLAQPVIPPHQKARTKLQEALALLDQPGPFCTLVSDTIRIYLEERFELHAPERTTEEFLEELQQSPVLTYDQKRTLGEFLMGCDLVKFARYEPGREEELQSIYDAAVRLIDETEPSGLPPSAGEQAVSAPSA